MIALLQLSCTVDEREGPHRDEMLEELKQKAQSPFNQFLSPPFHFYIAAVCEQYRRLEEYVEGRAVGRVHGNEDI